jgi:hypothetical protein
MARFHESVLAATHNSYERSPGLLRAQLDSGVRCIELDLHSNDVSSGRGYRIGHNSPGDGVEKGGGNPDSDRFGDWLAAVADWSESNREHAPITVVVDLKDDLTRSLSFDQGNPARLNHDLSTAFGERLLTAASVGDAAWPSIDELRGEVLVVLSGNEATRLGYLRDGAEHPAVALNSSGWVLEVHDSGREHLWYWTGRIVDDGTVSWERHGRYGRGELPAVALDDDGLVVEVHIHDDELVTRRGRLGEDGEIEWGPDRSAGSVPAGGRASVPRVCFDPAGSRSLVLDTGTQGVRAGWHGELRRDGSVAWREDDAAGGRPLPDKDEARAGGRTIRVSARQDGGARPETLFYAIDGRGWRRVCYPQLGFAESKYQFWRDDVLAGEGVRFHARAANDTPELGKWLASRRAEGKLVRLWGFASGTLRTDPPANFPATDHPRAQWYRRHLRSVEALRG